MIRNIIELSEKELNDLLTSEFEVIEKLNMYYFRLNITPAGIFVTKSSTDKVISDIDCVTNSMFDNIMKYSKLYEKIADQILEIYGECRIGIFYNSIYHQKYPIVRSKEGLARHHNGYLPAKRIESSTSKRISIDKFNDEYNGTFIFSDLFVEIKALNTETNFQRLIKSINDSNILLLESPLIKDILLEDKKTINKVIRTTKLIKEIKREPNKKEFYCSIINNIFRSSIGLFIGNHTYGGDYDSVEAIILRNNKIQCQIPLKETARQYTSAEKETKKSYRDLVLISFANEMMKNENLLTEVQESSSNYVTKIASLFINYIDNTDLFSKYTIEPEDLLPPNDDLQDMNYSYLDNGEVDNTVLAICKCNETYKNIFRILLHTLSKKISDNKFSDLPDNVSNYLNELIIALKYKNYREIAYELYKANPERFR